MAHLRQQIRAAFVAALTGLVTTGDNVFDGTFQPVPANRLPGMRVYAPAEVITTDSILGASRPLDRVLTVYVELANQRAALVDDEIDQSILEIEQAIAANQTLGGLCAYVQLSAIQREDDGSAELETVRSRLTFDVLYITALDAPDVPG